jgi:regulator of ribosome biosynthesis
VFIGFFICVPVFRADVEDCLRRLARDNTQLLFNHIFDLPVRRAGASVLAKLPLPATPLPREKHVPVPKAMTRWERFAKTKDIQKRKRSRMIWDESVKTWKPRYGYERANDESAEWVVELPDHGAIPAMTSDAFNDKKQSKKDRVAKNRKNQLGNVARTQKEQRAQKPSYKVPVPKKSKRKGRK